MRNLDEAFEDFLDTEVPSEDQDAAMLHLVSTLLHSSTVTHIMHFRSTKYSIHMALGDYYAKIIDLVDALTESYQGKFGLVPFGDRTFSYVSDIAPLEYLDSIKELVMDLREQIKSDSEIQNDIDSIVSLLNTTMYKIKYLG